MRVETRPDVTLLRQMAGSETHSGKVDSDDERYEWGETLLEHGTKKHFDFGDARLIRRMAHGAWCMVVASFPSQGGVHAWEKACIISPLLLPVYKCSIHTSK